MNIFKKNSNIGLFDKIIRIVLALVLAFLFFTGQISGLPGVILIVLAVTLVITGLVSFCPLYMPFKINTKFKK